MSSYAAPFRRLPPILFAATAVLAGSSSSGTPAPPGSSPPAADAGSADATVVKSDGGITPLPPTDGGPSSHPDATANPPGDSGAGPAHDAGSLPGVDAGAAPGVDAGAVSGAFRFLVFGDSRDNPDIHQTLLNSMSKMNPALILDTGDLWAGYSSTSTQWATITKSNANIAALLASNMYLVSRGNHETWAELSAFTPTLVRNNSETYSFSAGNAFFVSVGMDPAAATSFLGQALASPAATSATWRFVYSHYPVYDSGDGHGPVTGISAVEALCDQYHVTAFFSGHEHIYERFNQLSGQKVVDTSDSMTASKGTLYVVSGGGGAPFYSVTTPLSQSHTHTTDVNHYSVVDLTATTMSVQVLDATNAVIDTYSVHQ